MKKLAVISMVLLVMGCAQMVPARVNEISPGKYSLEASGNVFASIPSLLEKIEKRAVKLCGAGKYEFLDDGNFSNHRSPAYINGVDVGASYKVVRRQVVCK